MKNIIDLLEKMSSTASFTNQPADLVLASAQIDAASLEMVNLGDQANLEKMLDVRSKIVCLLIPAKEEDDEQEEKEEEQPKQDSKVVNF